MSITGIITETSKGLQTTSLEDEFLRNRIIFFNQSVNSESCNELIQKLMFLDQQDDKEVTIFINSPGGEVKSGFAVYDFIRLMRSPVRTVCTGICASMAAILFLAGTKREMLPHTEIMLHDPSYGNADISGVKPNRIKEMLEDLIKLRDETVNLISERTGINVSDVYKITEKDTYFKAKEAVKCGIATGIITELYPQN